MFPDSEPSIIYLYNVLYEITKDLGFCSLLPLFQCRSIKLLIR